MNNEINSTELAMVEQVLTMDQQQILKGKDLDMIDFNKVKYLIIRNRMALYKQHRVKMSLDVILTEVWIKSKHTYYDLDEKFNLLCEKCKKRTIIE